MPRERQKKRWIKCRVRKNPMLTKDNDNNLPFKEKDRACPELVEGVGMGFANIRRLVPILLFAACMTATAAFAGSPEPASVSNWILILLTCYHLSSVVKE